MASTHISVSQAAEILGKPYYHVHRLIRMNRIKAKKVGWAWLIRRSTVEALKKRRIKK